MKCILLIFSIVLLCGCMGATSTEILDNIKVCDEKEDVRQRDICVIGVAEEAKDLNVCTKVGAPRYREVCVGRVAVKKKDPALCEKIGDESVRAQCKVAAAGMVAPLR